MNKYTSNPMSSWPLVKPIGKSYFITCMLKGAVPKSIIRDIENKFLNAVSFASRIKNSSRRIDQIQYLRKRYVQEIDNLLDNRTIGPHFLSNPEIADLIKTQILKYNGHFYNLLAYTIVSNHFHLLIDTSIQLQCPEERSSELAIYATIDQIVNLIFSQTENQISRIIGKKGPIWELKTCDLLVNQNRMKCQISKYILNNAVKKGLVTKAEDYNFSYVSHNNVASIQL